MPKKVFIGCGAGFSGDRFDAAIPVIEYLSNFKGPKYLIYEVLGERTIALAQKEKLKNANLGYSPYLENYLELVLSKLKKEKIKVITNMGAANCNAAAKKINDIARKMDLSPFKIAVVLGDDILEYHSKNLLNNLSTLEGTKLEGKTIHSANVYLGAKSISDALKEDIDIVLVGRTTDSALVLGPLIKEFHWDLNEYDKLAFGTICGHLLECGAQVTGAYFADPGFKDVSNLENVGFPIAEVNEDGTFIITKPKNSGGCVTKATVTEQLLYEMHDPSNYIVPEVVVDISNLKLIEEEKDKIKVIGVKGKEPTRSLKATVCLDGGWMCEAEMSYSGINALERSKLAGKIVKERMRQKGFNGKIRMDIIGASSVFLGKNFDFFKDKSIRKNGDFRLRLSLISNSKKFAQTLADELQMLYCSGPAGGGGFRSNITEEISSASVLLDKNLIDPNIRIEIYK